MGLKVKDENGSNKKDKKKKKKTIKFKIKIIKFISLEQRNEDKIELKKRLWANFGFHKNNFFIFILVLNNNFNIFNE